MFVWGVVSTRPPEVVVDPWCVDPWLDPLLYLMYFWFCSALSYPQVVVVDRSYVEPWLDPLLYLWFRHFLLSVCIVIRCKFRLVFRQILHLESFEVGTKQVHSNVSTLMLNVTFFTLPLSFLENKRQCRLCGHSSGMIHGTESAIHVQTCSCVWITVQLVI